MPIYAQCYDPATDDVWERYFDNEDEMNALATEKDYSIRRIDENI